MKIDSTRTAKGSAANATPTASASVEQRDGLPATGRFRRTVDSGTNAPALDKRTTEPQPPMIGGNQHSEPATPGAPPREDCDDRTLAPSNHLLLDSTNAGESTSSTSTKVILSITTPAEEAKKNERSRTCTGRIPPTEVGPYANGESHTAAHTDRSEILSLLTKLRSSLRLIRNLKK